MEIPIVTGSPVWIDANGQLGTGAGGGGGGVTSFNGRTGAVLPASGDYDFSQLTGQVGSSQLVGSYPAASTTPLPGSTSYVQNGTAQQTGSNFNIDGTGTLGGKLTAGEINSLDHYEIGGTPVLTNSGLGQQTLSVGISTGTQGSFNTYVGEQAGHSNTGGGNTFVGWIAGVNLTAGDDNIAVGDQAGTLLTTGSNNIYLGHTGCDPAILQSCNESNTIRIGITGSGPLRQNRTFIGGITSQTISSGSPVWIDANGMLDVGAGGGGGVTSFNGRTGVVVSAANDYSFAQLSGIAAVAQIPSLASLYIQNTSSQQTGSNFNIDGNGTAGGTLTGTTAVNTTGTYQIGGTVVVNSSSSSSSIALGSTASMSPLHNVFVGFSSGTSNVTGTDNVYVGYQAGAALKSPGNTIIGSQAGSVQTTGSENTYLGSLAGLNATTNSSDVYIMNNGVAAENNTIRIGTQGTGIAQQNRTFIAGITGATSSGGINVLVNGSGQLGTTTSSRRYKDSITDMGSASSKLFQLRPVTFFYKPQYDDGSHLLQYGLIAEEVAKVFPDLVVYGEDGQPQTVRYHLLTPMLLNELQKQNKVITAQQGTISSQQQLIQQQQTRMSAQQQQIDRLETQNEEIQQRLSRLETLLGAQLK